MNTPVFPKATSFRETELTDKSFDDYDCYATHDNGGRSFVLQIRKDKKVVKLFEDTFTTKARSETSDHMVHQEIEFENGVNISRDGMYYKDPIVEREAYFKVFIKEIKADETPFEVFIGVDNTEEEFGYDTYYPGACVLLRFSQGDCWFFGTRIVKFTITEPIQALYSPIGNNDVVYPYLMTDSKCYCIQEWGNDAINWIEKEKIENRPPKSNIHQHFENNRSLWNRIDSSFLSERIIDKNYHRDPTSPLTSL